LSHGADPAPHPALRTWGARRPRATEREATHGRVNRTLLAEFESVLRGVEWEIALLQEPPPRWLRALAEATRSSGVSALTARNALPWLRGLLARLNPDLIASAEGGSNQTLARAPWRIERAKRETLTRRPERRR